MEHTINPISEVDIDYYWGCVALLCLSVIMDMNGVGMGTAGLPSGSIPPLCPEAAAMVKTTLTAQGKDLLFL